MTQLFQTDYRFVDRETKAEYVWRKYQSVLTGEILDVGADDCHLRAHLASGTTYTGIGLGGNPDIQVDLEREPIPFADNRFDCVLCLDVLEHLDNIHQMFDELCRVSRRYVIVSLPNAWLDFYNMLRFGYYRPGLALKFYGLPLEPPEDRHKWFFSNAEARAFVTHRSALNNMRVIQLDDENSGASGKGFRKILRDMARDFLFSDTVDVSNLQRGTLWAILEKQGDGRAE